MRRWEVEVRELSLKRADKVGNVKTPKEGGESAALSDAFQEVDVCIRRVVAVEDSDFD